VHAPQDVGGVLDGDEALVRRLGRVEISRQIPLL
jgi:hypothetical protein